MSRTLALLEAGWDAVRRMAERGQRNGALQRLTQLLARPDVPAARAAEWRRFAGTLGLAVGKYGAARKHLKAALRLEGTDGTTWHLLGRAWEEDPDGCDRRAAACYKKATVFGSEPLYRVSLGRAAARCGKVSFGTREMLAAVEAAPSDLAVVRVAVCGLLEVGKTAEARRVVVACRFVTPADTELAALFERVKFETARLDQRAQAKRTRENARYAQDAQFATEGDRVTLPFLRVADGTDSSPAGRSMAGGTVRRDAASFPRPHLARLALRKADR
jgi:Flp pilus assembly protein TadD